MAVLTESVSEGQRYLAERGIHASDVRQAFLSGVGVSGTPTILLVDDSGIVRRLWVGKLSAEDEEKAIAVIRDWRS